MAKPKQKPRERMAPPEPERARRGIGGRLWRAALVVAAIPLVLTILYIVVPPVSTLMIYERVVSGPIERQWVPLEMMAPSLVAGAIMAEDGRYCSHGGVDWAELDKVMDNGDGPQRGASTIAMQTVKNLFLWNSRSYVRKAFEIPLALYADLVLGKRRLMEIYLNIAELGPGISARKPRRATISAGPRRNWAISRPPSWWRPCPIPRPGIRASPAPA